MTGLGILGVNSGAAPWAMMVLKKHFFYAWPQNLLNSASLDEEHGRALDVLINVAGYKERLNVKTAQVYMPKHTCPPRVTWLRI